MNLSDLNHELGKAKESLVFESGEKKTEAGPSFHFLLNVKLWPFSLNFEIKLSLKAPPWEASGRQPVKAKASSGLISGFS